MSDKALTEHIGVFVRHHRLRQDKTQDEVASAAGISRSTLSLLERGETVTLLTLLQILRVLDLLYVMDSFDIVTTVSPIALAKQEQNKRQRAGSKKSNDKAKSEW